MSEQGDTSSTTYRSAKSHKGKKSARPNSARKGCWTCRRQHRKCDEQRPSCQKCRHYGVECEGYGSRRVAFRSAQPHSRCSAHTTTADITISAQNDIDFNASITAATATTIAATTTAGTSSTHTSSPALETTVSGRDDYPYCSLFESLEWMNPAASSIHLPVSLSVDELRLLAVFSADFARVTAISPLQDLYSQDIAPLAASHSHVRATVLALSAAYAAPRQRAVAFTYYASAVKALQASLPVTWEEKNAHLASTFVLAWCDITVFDPEKWIFHLQTACNLINENASQFWEATSGRRMIHAVGRLDCANSLSNRATPMLDSEIYQLMENCWYDRDSSSTEYLLDEACMRLHGIMGCVAELSYDWTNGLKPLQPLQLRAIGVIDRLARWRDDLPAPLKWEGGSKDGGNDDSWLDDKSTLFKMLWLHFFTAMVHTYHILGSIARQESDPPVLLARQCLALVKRLDAEATPVRRLYRGDMSVSFVLAVIGVLIDDPLERRWIQQYLTLQGREMLWCGYERASCLRAWWQSIGPGKRLIVSQPRREGLSWEWKPEMGMDVRIFYEDLGTKEIQVDEHFFPDCLVKVA